MSRIKNISGQRFGGLLVLCRAEDYIRDSGYRDVQWRCQCDCGQIFIAKADNLSRGKTQHCKSCPTRRKDSGPGRKLVGPSHVLMPEYVSWRCMKRRCRARKEYVSRGVNVCREWTNSFTNFLKDMGRKPSPIHTIDRINNDGDYHPDNCRWATPLEQSRNRSPRMWEDLGAETA